MAGPRRARRRGAADASGPVPAKARAPGARQKAPRKFRHNVYVIELDPRVLNLARFRAANPERDMLKPCVYVGMTGLTPEERFAKHKAGIRANSYVQRFGVRLLPGLYAYANPMPYEAAREMEVELAIALREAGYAVWQA
jgi:predicted GIY-YIG superfamily endonuclease